MADPQTTTTAAPPVDFIRAMIDEDLAAGTSRRARGDALSARAERLPPYRPREIDLPELRRRRGARRHVQSALRRHQPDQGGRRVRRRDQGGRRVARLQVGRAPVRVGLLRTDLRVRGPADQAGPGLRRQPDRRRDPRVPRDADRARAQQPVPRTGRWRRASTCSRGCGPASSRTASMCCARRSTWRRPT